MKLAAVFIFLIIIAAGFSFRSNYSYSNLPLLISYKKFTPPDSIQDFIKIYLQTKKIEVINWKQAMSLLSEGSQTQMMSLINSGRFNEQNAKGIVKNMPPVCNILAVSIFNDSTNNENYVIDSIHWLTDFMPVTDTTNKVFKSFIPQSENKTNPYIVLKSFADIVLQSKILK